MMRYKLTVYTSKSCGKCKVLKKWLLSKDIKFDVKDVTDDRLARTEVMKLGYTSVPVTVIEHEDDDKIVVAGVDIKKLTSILL